MRDDGLDLLVALIGTGALRIAPADEVFWYTSGTVGPYCIHAENLYGSPRKAAEMLDFIERGRGDKGRFPGYPAASTRISSLSSCTETSWETPSSGMVTP